MNRIDQLRSALPKGAFALITTDVSRQYLTGFASSLGYLFITPEKSVALFDSRYYEAAQKQVFCGIQVQLLQNLKQQASEILTGCTCLYVEQENTVATVNSFAERFERKVQPLKQLDQAIIDLRSTKTEEELQFVCQAQRVAERAFEDVLPLIRTGISERQIAAELEYRMRLFGSDGVSFETIAIAGAKTSLPHGVPDGNKVQDGDFVTMDFGATYNGYHSDMTRTVAVGRVTDEMKAVYETVLKANLAAEKAVCDGVDCRTVDAAARDVIKAAGYGDYFGHSTGHGVGLQIHEQPNVGPNSDQILTAGQIITDEPGIYLSGKFGVRIEDMLFVTKNGSKNLTNTKKSLIIL